MPIQLRLHSQRLADLAEIRDTDHDQLRLLLDRLQGLDPTPMEPKSLHAELSSALGNNPDKANRVMRTLLGLRAIIRQRKLAIDDVVDGVRFAIESADPPWDTKQTDRWKVAEPFLKQLLSVPAVRLVAIALDLTYEYENLLQGARVITDIRPVFSEDLKGVDGAVVSHTLRIRYDSTEGNHNISIAMDEKDIRDLEEQCRRALQKAETGGRADGGQGESYDHHFWGRHQWKGMSFFFHRREGASPIRLRTHWDFTAAFPAASGPDTIWHLRVSADLTEGNLGFGGEETRARSPSTRWSSFSETSLPRDSEHPR